MPTQEFDWQSWYNRWEAMQCSYITQRRERFNLMLRLPGWAPHQALRILDLGCGPGSLALQACYHFPQAEVVAIDSNPVLLKMGSAVAQRQKAPVQFIQADLRQPDWLAAYIGQFDLALSATALHWLSQASLAALYGRVYAALKPGGWFINADHMASDDPATQARYGALRQEKLRLTFLNSGADDWQGYWQHLEAALAGSAPALHPGNGNGGWEGTDDGYPRQFHFQALRACGFERTEIHWQDQGDAILAARKPASQ
jgi:SAM-dependent methyltransferase